MLVLSLVVKKFESLIFLFKLVLAYTANHLLLKILKSRFALQKERRLLASASDDKMVKIWKLASEP